MNDDDFPDDPADPLADEESANAGSVRAVRKRRIKQDLQQREAERFWRERVFNDEVGRREMWAILQAAHAFEDRFACGPNGFPQHEATWFEAGKQSLGQRLYQTWFVREPELVMLMLRENDPRFVKPQKDAK